MQKIIIDTDIGDDIDDAFAIALTTQFSQAELIGVTSVFRNAKARAQLVKKLLESTGRQVPVRAGEKLPYKEPFHRFAKDTDTVPPESSTPCQWEESYGTYSVEEGAVEYLAECAEQYGGELCIATIGPMTNLARAIEKYPDKMKRCGKIVSMGGSFEKFMPEWNYLCDPEAADIVIRSGIPFYAVGLDVTLKCPLEEGLLEKFRSSQKPVNQLLSLWLKRWFDFFGFEKSVMHDPLALASIVSDVCKFKKQYVKIELETERGAVHVSDRAEEGYSPVCVAVSADRNKFYNMVETALL